MVENLKLVSEQDEGAARTNKEKGRRRGGRQQQEAAAATAAGRSRGEEKCGLPLVLPLAMVFALLSDRADAQRRPGPTRPQPTARPSRSALELPRRGLRVVPRVRCGKHGGGLPKRLHQHGRYLLPRPPLDRQAPIVVEGPPLCHCQRWAVSLSMSSMTCPAGRFTRGGRCYVECEPGYTNTGELSRWNCQCTGDRARLLYSKTDTPSTLRSKSDREVHLRLVKSLLVRARLDDMPCPTGITEYTLPVTRGLISLLSLSHSLTGILHAERYCSLSLLRFPNHRRGK